MKSCSDWLKDAFKEKYQNQNYACTDTRDNYHDTKFVLLLSPKKYRDFQIFTPLE